MMNIDDEIFLRKKMQGAGGRAFFIKYFAEGEECLPMEIRPATININDYKINYDHSK